MRAVQPPRSQTSRPASRSRPSPTPSSDPLRGPPSPAEREKERANTVIPLYPAHLRSKLDPFRPIDLLLLAVSGGPDSIALMGLVAAVRDVPLAVATVDHGLRADSRAEAQAVARAAAALGLPHAILEVPHPLPRVRIQETARTARYDLLVAHAKAIGATHLATAHTLDDQAETILYRLARGSGPSGLVGMRPATHRCGIVHLRPLLDVPKARLVATCRANAWPFLDDPSNSDPRYARSRWRRLLPQLEAEGLGPQRLAMLSHRLARAEAALEATVEAACARLILARSEQGVEIDARALAIEPEEVVVRVLARALAEVGNRPPARPAPPRLQRLERLASDLLQAIGRGAPLKRTLGGAIVWARSGGSLRIVSEGPRRAASRHHRDAEDAPIDHAGNCAG